MFFVWTHVQYEILRLHGTCEKTTVLSTVSPNLSSVISTATALISAWNSWTAYRLVKNSWSTKEIIAEIHVRWTWWPRPPTFEALWHSIRQDTAAKHILQDVQDDICSMWTRTILQGKMCPHALLLEWPHFAVATCTPGLIYCPPRRLPSKPLLADCTPHGTFCRNELRFNDCSFSGAQNLIFCLFTNLSRWKRVSSLRWLCLLSCKLLTSLHPVIPPFTFPILHSVVVHVSKCNVFI
jgi:hypothetical protein